MLPDSDLLTNAVPCNELACCLLEEAVQRWGARMGARSGVTDVMNSSLAKCAPTPQLYRRTEDPRHEQSTTKKNGRAPTAPKRGR